MSDPLPQNLDHARRFLRMLDDTTEKFCFQYFAKKPDGQKDINKPPVFGTIFEQQQQIQLNQQARINVTVTMAATATASRKNEDVTALRMAFIDFDSKLIGTEVDYDGVKVKVEPLDIERLQNDSFPPHMIVESSPGNYHAYWMLQHEVLSNDPDERLAQAQAFSKLQKALARKYTADPGCTGLNWCMRVPGFWRFKDDDGAEPSLLKIIWEDDIEERVRYMPALLLKRMVEEFSRTEKPAVVDKAKGRKARAKPRVDEEDGREYSSDFAKDAAKENALKWLKKACDEISDCAEGGRDNLFNKHCMTAGGFIAAGALEEETTKERLYDAAKDMGLEEDKIRDKLKRVIEQGKRRPIVHDETPLRMNDIGMIAEKVLSDLFTMHDGGRKIRRLFYWAESFWLHVDGRYGMMENAPFLGLLDRWLSSQVRKVPGKEENTFVLRKVVATSALVGELESKLQRICAVESSSASGRGISLNTWVAKDNSWIPTDACVPFSNGLYNARTDEFIGEHPGLFNVGAAACSYFNLEEEAPTWNWFLNSAFELDDGEIDGQSIDLLQEWFGYCLTLDNSREKMMFIIGPTRSGKGTIEKAFRSMLSSSSVTSFDFGTLATDFGLQPLLGKSVAVCSDVRDMSKDRAKILQTVLNITGSDEVSVNRKRKDIAPHQLGTRLMLFANQLPEFRDQHSAILARTLIINMPRSFAANPDRTLKRRLQLEGPGITKWAVEGLKRLLRQDEFTMPEASIEAMDELHTLDSPLVDFVRDTCVINPKYCAGRDALYEEYKIWCQKNGFTFVRSAPAFGRELTAALARDGVVHKRSDPRNPPRVHYFQGVGILNDPQKAQYSNAMPPRYEPYDERHPPPM